VIVGLIVLGACVALILFGVVMFAGLMLFIGTGFVGIFTKSGRITPTAAEELERSGGYERRIEFTPEEYARRERAYQETKRKRE